MANAGKQLLQVHADFLAGLRELAALTGADRYLSDEGGPDWQYEFDHVGWKEGSKIKLGNLEFKVLYPPGHTPESISFYLRISQPVKYR